VIPTLRVAAADPEVRGAPLAVLLYLAHELDVGQFRPVKVAVVASALHIKDITAAWAIRRLAELGYLELGPKTERLNTYRLVWTMPASVRAQTGKAGKRPPASDPSSGPE